MIRETNVGWIQPNTSVCAELHDLADLVNVLRLTKGSHSHHFVFSFIYLESKESRENRVKKAKRVGESQFLREINLVGMAIMPVCRTTPKRGRRPLPHAI